MRYVRPSSDRATRGTVTLFVVAWAVIWIAALAWLNYGN